MFIVVWNEVVALVTHTKLMVGWFVCLLAYLLCLFLFCVCWMCFVLLWLVCVMQGGAFVCWFACSMYDGTLSSTRCRNVAMLQASPPWPARQGRAVLTSAL